MDVVFLPAAQAEFAEAVVYYNAQRDGLGEEFAGYYSGSTVQPSPTGVTAAGIEAQCLLLRSGFSPGPIDGIFGPMSQTAAMHFQSRVDSACQGVLATDGLVGPKTWPWLRWYAAPPVGCDGA